MTDQSQYAEDDPVKDPSEPGHDDEPEDSDDEDDPVRRHPSWRGRQDA